MWFIQVALLLAIAVPSSNGVLVITDINFDCLYHTYCYRIWLFEHDWLTPNDEMSNVQGCTRKHFVHQQLSGKISGDGLLDHGAEVYIRVRHNCTSGSHWNWFTEKVGDFDTRLTQVTGSVNVTITDKM